MANKELLHRVLRHIKDNPGEYDPVRWHRDFAGWTLRLAMPGIEVRKNSLEIETLYDATGERVWISDISPRAMQLLGINAEQAVKLFCASNTVADLERLVAEFMEPASPSDQAPATTPHVCQHVACGHSAVKPVPAWAKPEVTS